MKEHKQFLSLTQDLVFKTFFSRNKQVLLSLLRSFLPIDDTISDVEILNPEKQDNQGELHLKGSNVYPTDIAKKEIVLDLKVKLDSGENINVEMQAFSQKDFLKRVLFYWARLYTEDLKKGETYGKIYPTYSLIFTTFSVWDKKMESCITSFSIRSDEDPYILFNEDLKIVMVQLNKLKKTYSELLDLWEKWCYLLMNSSGLTAKEYEYLVQHEEMKMALDNLAELSDDKQLSLDALAREIWQHDQASRLKDAIDEGMEKGIAENQKATALKMLKAGFELSVISEITGLSEDKVKLLK